MKNLFTLCFLLCCSVSIWAQEKIQLNLELGATYTLKQKSVAIQKQNINGMTQDVRMTTVQNTDFKVIAINDGVYTLEATTTSTSIDQKTAMGQNIMDSEGPQSDPMNVMMKNLTNTPIIMTLDAQGSILSLDAEQYRANIMNGVEMPEMQKMQVESQMLASLSDQSLKEGYQTLFNIYPKTPVDLGDTWEKSFKTTAVIPINSTAVYKFTGNENGTYQLSSTADIATDEDASVNVMGQDAVANIKGKMKATYKIDSDTGWISQMDQEQNLSGTIAISASDSVPQAMKITLEITNNSVIK